MPYQRSRRCSEARKCAQAHLPQTHCNVPEPNPTIASPVTERKNKFSSSRKFFWSGEAKAQDLRCTHSDTTDPPPKPKPARGENSRISSARVRCGSRYCWTKCDHTADFIKYFNYFYLFLLQTRRVMSQEIQQRTARMEF